MDVIDFIKGIEKFTAVSFWDYKQFSWGYGTKAPGGGLKITKSQAEVELNQKVNEARSQILSSLKKPVSENAVAALVSFTFNLGFGNTLKLITDINIGKTMQQVADRLKLYFYAGGQPLEGLKERRKKEAALLLS